MMRNVRNLLLLLVLVGTTADWAMAQETPLERGMLAFREGEYEVAERELKRAVSNDELNAEAHFLLARVYYETPLKDVRRAGRSLDRALQLDPNNVRYLVAQLVQNREKANNFFTEKARESRRRSLAYKILALDSTNAYAHEELGTSYIRDFWKYRNAFMVPSLMFQERDRTAEENSAFVEDILDAQMGAAIDLIENPELQAGGSDAGVGNLGDMSFSNMAGSFGDGPSPGAIFRDDKFDFDSMREMGIPVQDLSRRAAGAYARAVGHLNRALETNPRHETIYEHLMRIFALQGNYDEALEMLQNMYVHFPEDVRLWTYLGLANYRAGNMDAATKAYEKSFSFMDPAMERAFTDLGNLVPREEQDEYRRDKVRYTAEFWTSKDPRFLTPYNERKLEHYSRIVYADLLYSAPDVGMRGWQTERGQILIRYGIPQTDVVLVPSGTSGIRTGAQDQYAANNDGSVSFDLASGNGGDFDMLSEANTFNIWDYGEFRFVFEDPYRQGEFRMYSPSAKSLSGTNTSAWENDYVIKAQETFRTVPERYEYEAPGRQIDLPYLVSTFKGADGQTDLYVNYGVPIVEYDPSEELININANIGTFLISGARELLVERRRSLYGLRSTQVIEFSEANLWVDSQLMSVPPGDHEVSVEFETASGNTVAIQRRAVDVRRYDEGRMTVSDLLLAYNIQDTFDGKPVNAADLVRDGLSITPAPWSVFDNERPIYLYFEVYNLGKDSNGRTNYEMEAVLVPKDEQGRVGRFFSGLFGGGNKGVSVEWPGAGIDADEGQYQILDVTNQEPGLYTLTLKVRDKISGREIERTQDLFLE